LLATDSKRAGLMSEKLGIPEQLCSILLQRGFTEEDAHHFLYPKLEQLPSPSLMKGLESAVSLILQARAEGRMIVVYGDYDVDGVTSTALLSGFLAGIGAQVCYYHPDRLDDGYGLSSSSVENIVSRHPRSLIVTVDCGISDYKPIQTAKENELSVIIVDHHVPPEQLPKADAIIDPLQEGCNFPFKYLAGVGLVFYLIIGLRGKLREDGFWTHETQPNLKELLDLVAIGSVADMVPLVDLNRVLVKAGLDAINNKSTRRKCLSVLFQICNIADKEIVTEDIGFQLGPRINAAGRLGNAGEATQLLMCDDQKLSYELAERLNATNERRKIMTEAQASQALDMAKRQVAQGRKVIILHHSDWHNGLIGIIASRVCEATNKPVIVLAGTPIAKGSARTTNSCNIYELLNYCNGSLIQFGGHKMAAGLTVKVSNIPAFTELAETYAEQMNLSNHAEELLVDSILPPGGHGKLFYEKYKLLGPFGAGNTEPKFMTEKPSYLRNIQLIGKNKDHLKFTMEIYGDKLTGVGFGFGHLADRLAAQKASFVFSISENWFKGNKNWQLVLHDIDFPDLQ